MDVPVPRYTHSRGPHPEVATTIIPPIAPNIGDIAIHNSGEQMPTPPTTTTNCTHQDDLTMVQPYIVLPIDIVDIANTMQYHNIEYEAAPLYIQNHPDVLGWRMELKPSHLFSVSRLRLYPLNAQSECNRLWSLRSVALSFTPTQHVEIIALQQRAQSIIDRTIATFYNRIIKMQRWFQLYTMPSNPMEKHLMQGFLHQHRNIQTNAEWLSQYQNMANQWITDYRNWHENQVAISGR